MPSPKGPELLAIWCMNVLWRFLQIHELPKAFQTCHISAKDKHVLACLQKDDQSDTAADNNKVTHYRSTM